MIDDSFNSKITAARTSGGATGFSRNQQDSEEPREPKHVSINAAILSAVAVERRLEDLIDKIVGEQRMADKPCQTASPMPTLAETLVSAPERIRHMAARNIELIEKLESLLF